MGSEDRESNDPCFGRQPTRSGVTKTHEACDRYRAPQARIARIVRDLEADRPREEDRPLVVLHRGPADA